MEDYRKYGHIDWKDLKVGMTLISSDRGGGPFDEEMIFIKAKREQIIEFDTITIRRGRIYLQYDDWSTKRDWEDEVHLSGRPVNQEKQIRFMWQFFHFAADEKECIVSIRTREELHKISMAEVEAREIEWEKIKKEKEEKSRPRW